MDVFGKTSSGESLNLRPYPPTARLASQDMGCSRFEGPDTKQRRLFCIPPRGCALQRATSLRPSSRAKQCKHTVLLLATPHHDYVGAGPYDQRLNFNNAEIWRTRKTQKPLAGMSRWAEKIRSSACGPDIRPSHRRSKTCVNSTVITWPYDTYLASKWKRVRKNWKKC